MDILNIYSISGLFNELYNPNVDQFHTQSFSLNSDNPLRRTNALFWAKLFSIQNLKHLITQITDAKIRGEKLSEKEKAIVANPNLFIDLLSAAPLKIVNQKLTERALFATMEQLEIFCRLMSKYIYKPFYLTIQEGFQEFISIQFSKSSTIRRSKSILTIFKARSISDCETSKS